MNEKKIANKLFQIFYEDTANSNKIALYSNAENCYLLGGNDWWKGRIANINMDSTSSTYKEIQKYELMNITKPCKSYPDYTYSEGGDWKKRKIIHSITVDAKTFFNTNDEFTTTTYDYD